MAKELEAKYPARVKVIVNRLPGPTSKGQMLNEMFAQVFSTDDAPELVVLHDSEDVIDARSFAVYAAYAQENDFIQAPVFSLNRGKGAIVASTYMDEFAERHTRELIVRDAVGAAIPSAGVGTCVTKTPHQAFPGDARTGADVRHRHRGLHPWHRSQALQGSSRHSPLSRATLTTVWTSSLRANIFPKTLEASIKQKTRWVYGINFEAFCKLGWTGDPWDFYFFLRDRKGMITSFLPPISAALLGLMLLGYVELADFPEPMGDVVIVSMWINFFALITRYVVRVISGYEVYGKYDWIGIAMRWPAALYINMAAVYRAWKTFLGESELATKPIVWSKTVHDIPDDFVSANR